MISEYDRLFGDQTLSELVTDLAAPDGTPTAVARARAWEGMVKESEVSARDVAEPWASFIVALAKQAARESARERLLALAQNPDAEPRVRLWSFTALRAEGWQPSEDTARELLGVVVEVPVKGTYDVLAAYSDGAVRFLGHVGQSSIVEGSSPLRPNVRNVLAAAGPLVAADVVVREKPAKQGPPDHLRLSALTPAGVRRVEVPWSDVEAGGPYVAFFTAATKLFDDVA